MRDITGIIVHCTATRPDWWQHRSTREQVEEVRRWHVAGNGWSDIGYHELIGRDGMLIAGRPMTRDGAHTKGRNRGTIGIALFGGHGAASTDQFADHFTTAQERVLLKRIAELQSQYGPLTVTGHNQYAAKGCPGFDVPGWYASHVAAKPTPKTTSWFIRLLHFLGGARK